MTAEKSCQRSGVSSCCDTCFHVVTIKYLYELQHCHMTLIAFNAYMWNAEQMARACELLRYKLDFTVTDGEGGRVCSSGQGYLRPVKWVRWGLACQVAGEQGGLGELECVERLQQPGKIEQKMRHG